MYDENRYRPDYIVKAFQNTGVFKVIRFKHGSMEYCYVERDKKDEEDRQGKLANNLIRARTTVFQLALCNPWQWFATLTLDSAKYDRYDLSKFRKDLAQHVRDLRKKYGTKIAYLIIPEKHKDGAWHMHGLFNGIPDEAIADFVPGRSKTLKNLKDKGFKNWPDYSSKFGFVSLGALRDPVRVAFYVTKYISKELAGRVDDYGEHLYYASQKLLRAERVGEYYGTLPYLDKYCTYDTEFCSVGLVLDEEFTMPDRYSDNGELVTFEDIPESAETSDNVVKAFREKELARIRADCIKELGLDLFDHISYEQLSLFKV